MRRAGSTFLALFIATNVLSSPLSMTAVRIPRSINLPFGTQTLAGRGGFFARRNHLNESPALKAARWTMAVWRLGMDRGGASMALLGLIEDPHAYRRLAMEVRKGKFIQEGLFANPVLIQSQGHDLTPPMTIRFEFAEDSEESYDAIRETLLRPELEAAKKNRLPQNHADLVNALSSPVHRAKLLELSDPILTRNPLKIVARNLDTGKIVGFVYPVFVRARNATELPNTWIGMSEWLDAYDPHPGDLDEWVMGDIWFTGGGNGAVATAMLDASYELGKAMGISRFFAYSNPRALPMFWEKFPDRRAELNSKSYLTRIIAPLVFERLTPLLAKGRIQSWTTFDRQVRRLVKRHTRGIDRHQVASRLLSDLRVAAAAQRLPSKPSSIEFQILLNTLRVPFEKGGYTISDPAISFHLKRGSQLARVIPNAFPNILGGPGIGGGYSFVMEYAVQLRHRFVMRFGERVGVRIARWHRYREQRLTQRAA